MPCWHKWEDADTHYQSVQNRKLQTCAKCNDVREVQVYTPLQVIGAIILVAIVIALLIVRCSTKP